MWKKNVKEKGNAEEDQKEKNRENKKLRVTILRKCYQKLVKQDRNRV